MKTLLSTVVISALLFAACGEPDSVEQSEEATADTAARTIEIIGTDDMKFGVTEASEGLQTGEQTGDYLVLEAIEVSAGEEISIRLTTESDMPPTAMSHNFILMTLNADVDQFAQASLTARDNDYISPDHEDDVIIHTEMLGDGESDTITFNAPDEPGEYTFICSFPGHYQAGMVGTLIVQ